ncbi:MAG: glycosyltransferase family 4 protein, partial [Promethearchaeota archaeon]
MRIGIEAVKFDEFGGGQIVVSEFIRILQEMGHEIVMFSDRHFNDCQKATLKKRWKINDFNLVYLPSLGNVSLSSILFNLKLHTLKLDAYFCVGWILLSNRNAKHIPNFRYALAPHTPFLYRKFRDRIRKSKMVYYPLRLMEIAQNAVLDAAGHHALVRVVQSEYIKSLFRRYYGIEYEYCVQPPVFLDDLKALNNRVENSIICIGRITPEKNYHVLIRLARKYPQYKFKIVGGYIHEKENARILLELIKNAKKLENLKVLINISRQRLVQELARSQYLLHLMRTEHFGIAVVEALACGVTPIVPKNCGPDEIINFGEFGARYHSFRDLISNFKSYLVDIPVKEKIKRSREFNADTFKKRMKIL